MTSTIWLTGLSGAGKSTLAQALQQALQSVGRQAIVLDGDEIRRGLCRDLGFSPADRSENIRRVAEVAQLLNRSGCIAITALISPLAQDRENARAIIGAQAMHEVFVSTPLAVCEARDPKGLYERARRGALAGFTGVGAPYDRPTAPALALDTSLLTLEDCVARILPLLASTRQAPTG
jgi:adenylylsulfate kinase